MHRRTGAKNLQKHDDMRRTMCLGQCARTAIGACVQLKMKQIYQARTKRTGKIYTNAAHCLTIVHRSRIVR